LEGENIANLVAGVLDVSVIVEASAAVATDGSPTALDLLVLRITAMLNE